MLRRGVPGNRAQRAAVPPSRPSKPLRAIAITLRLWRLPRARVVGRLLPPVSPRWDSNPQTAGFKPARYALFPSRGRGEQRARSPGPHDPEPLSRRSPGHPRVYSPWRRLPLTLTRVAWVSLTPTRAAAMPTPGLEPGRPLSHEPLKLACLPFHHVGAQGPARATSRSNPGPKGWPTTSASGRDRTYTASQPPGPEPDASSSFRHGGKEERSRPGNRTRRHRRRPPRTSAPSHHTRPEFSISVLQSGRRDSNPHDALAPNEVAYLISPLPDSIGAKGLEPSCNQLPFQRRIRPRGYAPMEVVRIELTSTRCAKPAGPLVSNPHDS